MLPELSYSALDTLGIPGLVRGLRNAAPILCYHNVVPTGHDPEVGDSSLHLPVDRFEQQIAWLARQYSVIPLDELVARILQGHSLKGIAAITFDDAYAGVFQYAWPVLKAHGVPATTFIVAGAAEKPEPFWWDYPDAVHADEAQHERWITACHGDAKAVLPGEVKKPSLPGYMWPASWRAIRVAGEEGMGIGAHTMTHRALSTLTERDIQFEVYPCRGIITQRLGIRPSLIAYPYGLFDDRVFKAVQSTGYVAGLSLDSGLNHNHADRWALRRINVPSSLPAERFEAWTAGLIPRRKSA